LSEASAFTRSARAAIGKVVDELGPIAFRLPIALGISNKFPPLSLSRVRLRVLRLGGLRIGDRTTIGGRMWIAGGPSPARSLTTGVECFINDSCRLDTSARITIGDHVHIGHDVRIITSSHEIGDTSRRAGWSSAQPVEIGTGAWIGAGSMILPGVRIGDGSIVAAGAVVARSVADNTLVGGVPARYIRDLDLSDGSLRPDGRRARGGDGDATCLPAADGGSHH
jgi:acetyltransferase-like isoleucine patch superfamily enzyme